MDRSHRFILRHPHTEHADVRVYRFPSGLVAYVPHGRWRHGINNRDRWPITTVFAGFMGAEYRDGFADALRRFRREQGHRMQRPMLIRCDARKVKGG